MSDIPTRIREYLAASGLTIEGLADALGVKSQRVKDVLRGRQRAPADMLAVLAKRKDADIQYILTGYHADEIAHQRAHAENIEAAKPGVANLLASQNVSVNEMIHESLNALALLDGAMEHGLQMLVRGLALDQQENGIHCTDDDEKTLITDYRRVDERGRQVILNTASALADRGASTPDADGNHVQQNFHANVDQVAGRDIVNHGRSKKK